MNVACKKYRSAYAELPLVLVVLALAFKPFCLSYLPDSNYVFLNAAFLIGFFVVSLLSILWVCLRGEIDFSLASIVAIGFILILSSSATSPASAVLRNLREAVCFVGLACFLSLYAKRNFRVLVQASFYLFFFYTICEFASIVLTNGQGLIPDQPANARTFFFGGKNSIFMYGLLAITSTVLWSTSRPEPGWKLLPPAISAAYCFMAQVIGSASSTVFFGLAIIVTLFWTIRKKTIRHSYNVILLAIFFLLFFVVVVFQQTDMLGFILESAGRSSTFSGRTGLWDQAVEYVVASPIFGSGADIQYYLSRSAVEHAHSFFLDGAAKYGVLYIGLIFADITYLMLRKRGRRMSVLDATLTLLLFLLIIHSQFDVLHFTIYVYMRAMLLHAQDTEKSATNCVEQHRLTVSKAIRTSRPEQQALAGTDS